MDEKLKLDNYKRKYHYAKKHKQSREADMYKNLILNLQNKALQVYQTYSEECPREVWDYFTGKRKKSPSASEILLLSKALYSKHSQRKYTFAKIIAGIVLALLGYLGLIELIIWLWSKLY
jgi:hypothetical protein